MTEEKRFKRHSKYPFMFQDTKFGIWYFVKTINGKRVKRSTGEKQFNKALALSQGIENEARKLDAIGYQKQKGITN